MTVEKQARELAARMNAAIGDIKLFADYAPVVVEQCRGIGGAVWRVYDDAGGNAHSWTKPYFHKVRLVRNSPVWGRKLDNAITDKAET